MRITNSLISTLRTIAIVTQEEINNPQWTYILTIEQQELECVTENLTATQLGVCVSVIGRQMYTGSQLSYYGREDQAGHT